MSTCLDISLGATLTNAASLPIAYVDPVLGSGSLMLFEPNHPSNPQIGTAIPTIPYNNGYTRVAVQFPNIAAIPAAPLLASQTATSWQVTTTAVSLNGAMQVSNWGTCPGVHPGDELWNAAGTVMLGVFATDNLATGQPTLSPAQQIPIGTYTVKRSIKPIVWRMNDSMSSGGAELNFGYEWTPKGGLHVASSRSTMATGQQSLSPALPGSIKEYIYANPGHSYFMSVWYKLTQPLLAAYNGPAISVGKNSASGYLFSTYIASTAAMTNYAMPVGARNTAGMIVEQMANAYTGTAMSNAYSDFLASVHLGVGNLNGSWGGTYGQNTSASVVFYRTYLEDLTASGRTFAQVKAKDDLAYSLAFGAGGRYAGDTFTAPATLMP